MAVFKYTAVSRDGAKVSGVVEAYDSFEAVGKIKETCSIVTTITEVPSLPGKGVNLLGGRRLSDKTLALLCSQFTNILQTGLPLVRAVELIYRQTGERQLKDLLKKVTEDVSSGYGLAQSLENKGGKILPTTFIETVRAGEESGTLVETFRKLHQYYERAANINSKVRSAMMYPAFLLALTVVVLFVVLGVTMPVFTGMFQQFDVEMPALTQGLIALSNFLSAYWWLLLMVLAAVVIALHLYAKSEKGSLQVSRLLLKLPVLGRVNLMKAAAQFANTLSTLLTAGVPLIRAAEVTSRVLDNRYLSQRIGLTVPSLEEGNRLGEQLMRQGDFPEMLCEMTIMGEDTGSLEDTLDAAGVYYDAETATASERALSMLQPTITVIMGILIGTVVLGLYLPMFALYQGM